jgi:hypothetical protein
VTEIKTDDNLDDIAGNFSGVSDIQELDDIKLDILGDETSGKKDGDNPLKGDGLDELEVPSDIPLLSFDDFLQEKDTKVGGNEELKEKIKKLKEKINEEN